jgi:hypothetical protein
MDGPVRLSDVIVPEVFNSYMTKDTVQTLAYFQAGVIRQDADMASKLAGGGRTFNVPFWKDLDDEESDTATDDPDDYATPGSLGSGKDVAVRQFRTRGWSTMNLTAELAGSDPMQRINSRVNAYWQRQFDMIIAATLQGVFADNAANDGGDMIEDISMDSAGTPASTNLISAEAVMDAAQTLGDVKSNLKLIVMHSDVNTRLAKQDLITFRPDSQGKVMVPYYLDYRVHVSDRATVVQGAHQMLYHNYLLGADAIGWAESPPAKPVETESEPSAGRGSGAETLWTRRQFGVHPYGIKWADAQVAGEFPTNSELKLAANWDRVYPERKQIPMADLITNG